MIKLRVCLAHLLVACFCLVVAVEAKKAKIKVSEGFFQGAWSDVAWRLAKVCFALSPVIGIISCCLCAGESKEEEDLKRSKKTDSGC